MRTSPTPPGIIFFPSRLALYRFLGDPDPPCGKLVAVFPSQASPCASPKSAHVPDTLVGRLPTETTLGQFLQASFGGSPAWSGFSCCFLFLVSAVPLCFLGRV